MTDRNADGFPNSGGGACTLTAAAIADHVKGELHGDRDLAVSGVAPLDRAERWHLSMLSQARYGSAFRNSRAGIVLLSRQLEHIEGDVPARIIVGAPHEALLSVLPLLYPEAPAVPGIAPSARIGKGAVIGDRVTLDAFAVVGENASLGYGVRVGAHSVVGSGVSIGAGSRIFPNVTLYPGAELGERVIVHSGARVASDGFGYVQRGGEHAKIPHVGRCIIADDVEIGANTTLDRGSIDDTFVGAGTKIDNLVQVGHNVRIGSRCLIMAQVGIAGSTRIGDGCVIAGQAGIGGHLTIGDRARIGAQAGVFGDVPAGEVWSGYPARPHRESLRASGALFKLSGMLRELEKLIEKANAR